MKWFLLTSCILIYGCVTTKQPDVKSKAAELKMAIGVSHLQANNLPLALKELLDAAELDPQNPVIQNNLGLVYYFYGKNELSLKYFSQAYRLNPRFTEAKNNAARVYIDQGQFQKAEALLSEVAADLTYPNTAGANFNYGLLNFSQKKYDLAKTYFARVLEKNREDCVSLVYYSRSFLETKKVKQAADQFDKSLEVCHAQQIDEAHYYSAIAYYRLGQKSKSLARFVELTTLFPEGKNSAAAKKMIELIQIEKK